MKRVMFAVFVVVGLGTFACGGKGSGPSAPTPTPAPVAQPTPAPAPVLASTFSWTGGSFSCVTGLCTTLVVPVTNNGPGCATGVQIVFRAFGSDGNGVQLGIDIPLGLPGGSLYSVVWKVGTTLTLQNLSPFNDVRSAHTAFKAFVTSKTSIACS